MWNRCCLLRKRLLPPFTQGGRAVRFGGWGAARERGPLGRWVGSLPACKRRVYTRGLPSFVIRHFISADVTCLTAIVCACSTVETLAGREREMLYR